MRPNPISFYTPSVNSGLKTDPGILGHEETAGRKLDLRSTSVTRSLLRMLLYFDQGRTFALPLVSDSRGRQLVKQVFIPPYLTVLVTCCSTLWTCLLPLIVVGLAPPCLGGSELNNGSCCITAPLEVSVEFLESSNISANPLYTSRVVLQIPSMTSFG